MIQITPENAALEKPFSYNNFILVPLEKIRHAGKGKSKKFYRSIPHQSYECRHLPPVEQSREVRRPPAEEPLMRASNCLLGYKYRYYQRER